MQLSQKCYFISRLRSVMECCLTCVLVFLDRPHGIPIADGYILLSAVASHRFHLPLVSILIQIFTHDTLARATPKLITVSYLTFHYLILQLYPTVQRQTLQITAASNMSAFQFITKGKVRNNKSKNV